MKLKYWTPFEIVWLACFTLIATFLTILWKDNLFAYVVFLTGVFCVVLAAKGSIWTYAYGIFNSLAYAYLAYQNGLFGEMGLNLIFFVPTNIIGFFLWKKHMDNRSVSMRSLSTLYKGIVVALCFIGIVSLGFLLSKIDGQNSPYIDATTNIISIIATILMLLRYKEQWLLYIVLNCFTILMWSIRTMNGSTDGLMMIVMWSAYLINAVYGYINWNRGAILSEKQASR